MTSSDIWKCHRIVHLESKNILNILTCIGIDRLNHGICLIFPDKSPSGSQWKCSTTYKTGFVSREVLHLLSKLQNWICLKTRQYKTCIVSNTKFEASIRATKLKHWQPHITSETVKIFIQNEKAGLGSAQSRSWCGRSSIGAKPVLVQQVWGRHKASFGAVTKPV